MTSDIWLICDLLYFSLSARLFFIFWSSPRWFYLLLFLLLSPAPYLNQHHRTLDAQVNLSFEADRERERERVRGKTIWAIMVSACCRRRRRRRVLLVPAMLPHFNWWLLKSPVHRSFLPVNMARFTGGGGGGGRGAQSLLIMHTHNCSVLFIRQRLQCPKVDLKAHGVRLIVSLSLPLNLPARQLGSTSPEVVVVNQPLQLSSSFSSFSSSSAVLLVVLFSVLLSPKG